MANIITTGVGAGAIVTISWERNTWAGSGLQPAQLKSFSGEQAKTLLSDCISSVKKIRTHPSLISSKPWTPSPTITAGWLFPLLLYISPGLAVQGTDALTVAARCGPSLPLVNCLSPSLTQSSQSGSEEELWLPPSCRLESGSRELRCLPGLTWPQKKWNHGLELGLFWRLNSPSYPLRKVCLSSLSRDTKLAWAKLEPEPTWLPPNSTALSIVSNPIPRGKTRSAKPCTQLSNKGK